MLRVRVSSYFVTLNPIDPTTLSAYRSRGRAQPAANIAYMSLTRPPALGGQRKAEAAKACSSDGAKKLAPVTISAAWLLRVYG